MQYVELLSIIKKYKFNFTLSLLIGLVSSVILYYFLPKNFVTEGTLFVYPVNSNIQKEEVTSDLNFARNLIGLSESPEFRKKFNENLGVEVSYIPLIGVSYGLKIKEVTPNLVTISVSGSDLDFSKNKFQKYRDLIMEYSQKINKGNARFEISSLEENPLTYEVKKNLTQFISIGAFFGLFLQFTYIYLRNKK